MTFLKRLFGLTKKKRDHKLPDGWIEIKISDDKFIIDIPQEQRDKWILERHKHDKVNELIKKDGFYDKPHGRAGTIYHVDNGKLCEIDYEISGVKEYGILIFFESLQEWILPDKIKLTSVEKLNIKEKLELWLGKNRIKAEL